MKAEKYQRSKRGGIYNMFKPKTMKKNKTEKQIIVEYKKGREFNSLKVMLEARGGMDFTDDLFKSLTGKQRDDIINVEVGESAREKWTTQAWWKGMSITERKNAFIRITQINA